MSKLLNYWKVLSLGAVVTALGMFAASCVEDDPDEPVTPVTPGAYYTVEVNTGAALITYKLEAGDTVYIDAEFTTNGVEFVKWVALNADKISKTNVTFGDTGSASTYFIVPRKNVFVGATYAYEESGASVRFTWEAEQNNNIWQISVSYDDVASWYKDVYQDIYLAFVDSLNATKPDVPADILDYVSVIPFDSGIVDKRLDNFYDKDIPASLSNKGKYWPIEGGSYTAICSVIDSVFKDTFDIVANYDIDDGEMYEYFFDVGFDVGLFLSDDPLSVPEKWVVFYQYDNQHQRPYLEKSKSKSAAVLAKVIEKDNVTYYVLKRPTKK